MSLIDTVKTWTARLAGARTAIGEVHDLDTQLRAAHRAAVKERDRLATAPGPRVEAVANVEALIDAHAAAWGARHTQGLLSAVAPGLETRHDGVRVARTPRLPEWMVYVGPHEHGGREAALFPDLVKSRLRGMILGASYVEGPAAADRERLVAEADAKIRAIEDQHTELVGTAAAFTPPIVLALLPAVKTRRENEARKKKLADEAAANRGPREQAINATHAEASRNYATAHLAPLKAMREGR